MPAAFDPERLLSTLARYEVEHVLIGGLAASLHGSPATTNDADICPSRTTANLEKLAQALGALDARIRTERQPDGLPFDRSAAFLGAVALLKTTTVAGDLDLAFEPSGLPGGYDELVGRAVQVDLGDFTVLVAALDDVIHSKETADRPRDRAVLPLLKALRDELG